MASSHLLPLCHLELGGSCGVSCPLFRFTVWVVGGADFSLPRLAVRVAFSGRWLRFLLLCLVSDTVFPPFRLSEVGAALLPLTLWRASFSASSEVLPSWRCFKLHFKLAPLMPFLLESSCPPGHPAGGKGVICLLSSFSFYEPLQQGPVATHPNPNSWSCWSDSWEVQRMPCDLSLACHSQKT